MHWHNFSLLIIMSIIYYNPMFVSNFRKSIFNFMFILNFRFQLVERKIEGLYQTKTCVRPLRPPLCSAQTLMKIKIFAQLGISFGVASKFDTQWYLEQGHGHLSVFSSQHF